MSYSAGKDLIIRRSTHGASVNIPDETRNGPQMHGRRCRYLGESSDHKNYVFIECLTNRILYSRDADFFPDWKTNPTCKTGFDLSCTEDYTQESKDSEYLPLRASKPSNQLQTLHKMILIKLL
jgi:hypothetical protein